MKSLALISVCMGLAMELASAADAVDARPISPGSDQRFEESATTCPDFSWTASADPDWFELAVFEVEIGSGDPSTADLHPVTVAEIPGSGRSWTPSVDRCMAPGRSFVWYIRSHDGNGPSAWSPARRFASPPSVALDHQAIRDLLASEPAAMTRKDSALDGRPDRGNAGAQQGAGFEMTMQGEVVAGRIDVESPSGSIVTQTTAASEAGGRLRANQLSMSSATHKTSMELGLESFPSGEKLQFVTSTPSGDECNAECADLELGQLLVENTLVVSGPITFANGFTGYEGTGGGGFFEVPSRTSVRVDTNPSDCGSRPVLAVRLLETDADQIGIVVNCGDP